MTQDREVSADQHSRKAEMDELLEGLGWGVLLVVVGAIWLMPARIVPPGTWLIAAGLIILGLDAVRYLKGIGMRGFSVAVGMVALFAGVRSLFGLDLPLFPVALIVTGIWMLVKRLVANGSTRGI